MVLLLDHLQMGGAEMTQNHLFPGGILSITGFHFEPHMVQMWTQLKGCLLQMTNTAHLLSGMLWKCSRAWSSKFWDWGISMLCTLKECKGDVTVPFVPKGREHAVTLSSQRIKGIPPQEVCHNADIENKPEPWQLKPKTKNKQKRLYFSLSSELETSNQQVACKVLRTPWSSCGEMLWEFRQLWVTAHETRSPHKHTLNGPRSCGNSLPFPVFPQMVLLKFSTAHVFLWLISYLSEFHHKTICS